jgi:hypothetical protein
VSQIQPVYRVRLWWDPSKILWAPTYPVTTQEFICAWLWLSWWQCVLRKVSCCLGVWGRECAACEREHTAQWESVCCALCVSVPSSCLKCLPSAWSMIWTRKWIRLVSSFLFRLWLFSLPRWLLLFLSLSLNFLCPVPDRVSRCSCE